MAGTSTKKVRKPSKRSKPSPLPSQYEFTPRTTEPPPRGNRRAGPTVSDYPPPRQLFEESTPRTQPRAASTPLSQPAPPPQPRGSQTWANVRPRQPTVSIRRQSPISSEAQNSQNTEAPEGPDEDEPVPNSPFPVEPNLSEDQTRLLNALLSQPGRERYTMSLSPTFEPGTMWLVTYLSEYFKLMRLCLWLIIVSVKYSRDISSLLMILFLSLVIVFC